MRQSKRWRLLRFGLWLLCPALVMAGEQQSLRLPDGRVLGQQTGVDWPQMAERDLVYHDDLQANGYNTAQALTRRVPSLQMSAPNSRLTSFSIRGLGSSSFNNGLESNVGLYSDGVQLGRQGMFPADLGDVERIEVLRGPQGTLYGKNSSAGVLHVINRSPQWQPGAELQAEYGEYGRQQLRGYLTGPLVDEVLAGRLTFYQRRQDGFLDNTARGGQENDEDRDGLRGQLLWRATEGLQVRLLAEHSRERERCCAYPYTHISPSSRASAAFVGYPLPSTDLSRRQVDLDGRNSTEIIQQALTLHADQQFANGYRLSAITGWRNWDYQVQGDLDGSGLNIASQGNQQLQHEQFSQELRLAGQLHSQLDFLLGYQYLRQHMDTGAGTLLGRHATDWLAAGVANELGMTADMIDDSILEGAGFALLAEQYSTTHALYGQLDWQWTPARLLSAGLRYNHERKRGVARRQVTQPPATTDPFGAMLRGVVLGNSYQRSNRTRDDHVTGHLQLTQQFGEQLEGHVRLASSYKAGGINAEPTGNSVKPVFDAERANSVELGLRHQLQDGRGVLGVTLYRTEVEDYQGLTYDPDPTQVIPQRSNLTNIGKVRSQGVELDSRWMASDNLNLYLALAWNDSRYRDADNAPCPPGGDQVFCDLSGKRLYNAPRWSTTAGLEQLWPLDGGLELLAGANYHWRSGFDGSLERGTGSEVGARGVLDLHAGIARPGSWELGLLLHNALDKDYISGIYALTGNGDYGARLGAPRIWSMRLRLAL